MHNHGEMVEAAHRQYGTISIDSDVSFPTAELEFVVVVAWVKTHRGHYTARSSAPWQTGADLTGLLDTLTQSAEAEALWKAGVRPGQPQPTMTPADPLPIIEPARPSPFTPCASPGTQPDVYAEPCSACGGSITDYYGGTIYLTAARVVELGQARHSRTLCADCSGKLAIYRKPGGK